MAIRICDYLKIPKGEGASRILGHWACYKVSLRDQRLRLSVIGCFLVTITITRVLPSAAKVKTYADVDLARECNSSESILQFLMIHRPLEASILLDQTKT